MEVKNLLISDFDFEFRTDLVFITSNRISCVGFIFDKRIEFMIEFLF